MKKIILIFLFVCNFTTSKAIAEEKKERVYLADLIEIARRDNPEINSARKVYLAAKSAVIPSITPEYPWIGYGRDDKNMQSYSISQGLPFPTKLYLAGKEMQAMRDALYQTYLDKEREIVARLKSEFYHLFFIDKEQEIYQESKELLEFYVRAAQSKYTVGQSPISEVLRAQIELAKYENMLITLKRERETVVAQINYLLNRDPETPLGEPVEPQDFTLKISSFNQLLEIARRKNPRIQSRYYEWQSARHSLNISRWGYLPDFMGSYKWMENNGWEVMAQMNFPIYFWKQIYQVKEKSHQADSLKESYQSEINEISYRLREIWTQLDTTARLIKLYKEVVIPQAEQGLKSAEVAYQANKLSFLELLDMERSLLDFRREYYQYIYEYEKSLAELEALLGGEL